MRGIIQNSGRDPFAPSLRERINAGWRLYCLMKAYQMVITALPEAVQPYASKNLRRSGAKHYLGLAREYVDMAADL